MSALGEQRAAPCICANRRRRIPWAALATRDQNATTDSAGGYTLGVDVLPVVDILRPFSAVLQAGITVIPNLRGDTVLPRASATSTVAWMSSETASATPADAQLAATTMIPKIGIGVIQASQHFMKQANDPEDFLRRELLRTAGALVDGAVLNGAGSGGAPLGILNVSGVGTQSGTSLAWSGALHMNKLAADANVQDGSIAFIGTTAVKELLEARTKETGSGRFVWEDNMIAACPAYASTLTPSATLPCGPFSMAYLGLWGDGFQFETNPYDPTLFKSGSIQARVIVGCDVALGCAPAAFTKSSSIT